MAEMVNHPSHYNQAGRKECIVEMEELYGPEVTAVFCLTNAYKYLYRDGSKENTPYNQDKHKARWYFDYVNGMIERHGILFVGGIRVKDTDLYLDIRGLLGS